MTGSDRGSDASARMTRGRGAGGPRPGDGDGFVACALGHRHWGRHGAAGLLLRWDAPGGRRVLLARRPLWTHEGGTWAIPGGARDSGETAVQAALREAREEVGLLGAAGLDLVGCHHDDHGGWAYTTVVAETGLEPAVRPVSETAELRWVAPEDVTRLRLHPGFHAAWPSLRAV